MLDHVEQELTREGDEPVNRVVDVFLFVDDLSYLC